MDSSTSYDTYAYDTILRFSKEPIYRLKLDCIIKKEKNKEEIMGDKGKTTFIINEMYDHFYVRFPPTLMNAVIKLSPKNIEKAMNELRQKCNNSPIYPNVMKSSRHL